MKVLLIACLFPCVVLSVVPGGITPTTVKSTDEAVVFAVQAINKYFAANDDRYERTLVNVMSAKTQVVAGQNLYLTLHLTGAPTGDDYCDITVWSRVWLKNPVEHLIVSDGPTCWKIAPIVRREIFLGGESARKNYSTAPEEVVSALDFAVCAWNDQSNSIFLFTLGNTSSVQYTTQVTSGLTLRFYTVPLAQTSCRKQSKCVSDMKHCKHSINGVNNTNLSHGTWNLSEKSAKVEKKSHPTII